MRAVRLEVLAGDSWRIVGSVAEPEPCGSLSSQEDSGRQVYLFGFMDGSPGVWRSRAGLDVESEAFRMLMPIPPGVDGAVGPTSWKTVDMFERLSDLAEPFELEVRPADDRRRVRFSCE